VHHLIETQGRSCVWKNWEGGVLSEKCPKNVRKMHNTLTNFSEQIFEQDRYDLFQIKLIDCKTLGENDDGMKYTVNAIRKKIRTTKSEQRNSNNEIRTTKFEQRNSNNEIRTRENSWKPKVVALLYEPKGKSLAVRKQRKRIFFFSKMFFSGPCLD
jgi:hypothetical protein